MPEMGETKPAEALVNDLESRLFKGRKEPPRACERLTGHWPQH
jgi:hypothetical protein